MNNQTICNPHSSVLMLADSIVKIVYDDRICKIHQTSYCHISAAQESDKDTLVLCPASLYINGTRIDFIEKHGDVWRTDLASNCKRVNLKPCERLQIDHQSILKNIGLSQEISHILSSTILFHNENISIGSTISSLIFIREKNERFIRITPSKAHVRDPIWGIRPVEYFEHQHGHWSAVSKRQAACTGKLEIV